MQLSGSFACVHQHFGAYGGCRYLLGFQVSGGVYEAMSDLASCVPGFTKVSSHIIGPRYVRESRDTELQVGARVGVL